MFRIYLTLMCNLPENWATAAGDMAHWAKCSLCKHEDLSSDPYHLSKTRCNSVHLSPQLWGRRWSGYQKCADQLASLAKKVIFGFSMNPVSKSKVHWGWGDSSVARSTCFLSMRTEFKTPRTHVKIHMWLHRPINSSTRGRDRSCNLICQLAKPKLWASNSLRNPASRQWGRR